MTVIFPAADADVTQASAASKASVKSTCPCAGLRSGVGASVWVGTGCGVFVGGNQTMVGVIVAVAVGVCVGGMGVGVGNTALQAETSPPKTNNKLRKKKLDFTGNFYHLAALRPHGS